MKNIKQKIEEEIDYNNILCIHFCFGFKFLLQDTDLNFYLKVDHTNEDLNLFLDSIEHLSPKESINELYGNIWLKDGNWVSLEIESPEWLGEYIFYFYHHIKPTIPKELFS